MTVNDNITNFELPITSTYKYHNETVSTSPAKKFCSNQLFLEIF